MSKITPYDWQTPAIDQLVALHQKQKYSLDTSDTGTGKTVIACELVRRINQPALVITPKSVLSSFKRVATSMEVPLLDVVNVEKLKTGRTKWLKKAGKEFVWQTPANTLLIFDEIHRFGGAKSQNGKILALAKACGYHIHGMSATLCDTPLKMRAPGYLLDLHNYSTVGYWNWCKKLGCFPSPFRYGELMFPKGPSRLPHIQRLHEMVKPHSVRLRIDEIPGFPECDTQAMLYDLNDEYLDETNKIYEEMEEAIASPDRSTSEIVLMLRARQRTELLKVPLLTDLVDDIVEEDRSAVVFVNFRDTLEQLVDATTKHGVVKIVGGQSDIERSKAIDSFQADQARVIVVMSQCGGLGLSLHDINGVHPRTALITPSYSAVEMKQVLGRIHRSGGKSKAIQRLVLAAGTIEERIYEALSRKLHSINGVNDGSMADADLR